MENRYIGPNKVFSFVIAEYKTPKGKEIVKVIYESEKVPNEIMPLITFEALSSETPNDWNWVRNKRYEELLKEISGLCLEYDIVYNDIGSVTLALKDKLEAAFDRATNFLWTKDDDQCVPGYNPLSLRTLLETEEILKGITKNGKSKEENQS